MARNPNRAQRGELPNFGSPVFSSKSEGKIWTIKFRPKRSVITQATQLDGGFTPPKGPLLLAKGNDDERTLEIYPHNTTAQTHGLFAPKYPVLRIIRFENLNMMVSATSMEDAQWVLNRLIDGFIRTPAAGLGIDYELISIVKELEAAGISKLIVRAGSRKGLPEIDASGTLTMAGVQFGELRRVVRAIHNKALDRAQHEKHRIIHNTLLTVANNERFPAKSPPYERGAITAAIRAGTEAGLTQKDQDATLAAMVPVARQVVRRKPEAIQAVARQIELASLEELVDRYHQLLATNGSETNWQTFFRTYPFILKLAFGYPIVAMGEQVSVGGGRFDGKGEKIADFTVTAALSGNLALVEIKKPSSPLLSSSPYREAVYAPSRELSGSVAQILDQKYHLQMDFASKKVKSRNFDVEAYAIQCLVIIGSNPKIDNEQKSFEFFRRNLRQVFVITFDELLTKLKAILNFLKADLPDAPALETDAESKATDDENLGLDDTLGDEDLETD